MPRPPTRPPCACASSLKPNSVQSDPIAAGAPRQRFPAGRETHALAEVLVGSQRLGSDGRDERALASRANEQGTLLPGLLLLVQGRRPQQELVAEVQRYWGPGRAPAHRYVALLDGQAVGKAYLSLAGPPGVASIYGMSVVPKARGRGIARDLTTALLARAREQGCSRTVLHATD